MSLAPSGKSASFDGSPHLDGTPETDVMRATITRLRKTVRELDRLCHDQQERIRVLTAELNARPETQP